MNETDQQPIFHEVVPAPDKRWPFAGLTRRQSQLMAIVAAAILVTTLGYFTWYKPNRPEMVLASSLIQTMQLQSTRFKAVGTLPSGSFMVDGSGSAKGVFDIVADYKTAAGSIQLNARSTDGGDIYTKFNGLSSLSTVLGPQATQYGIGATSNPFTKLDGTWLVVAKETKDTLLKDTQSDIVPATVTLGSADKHAVAEAYQRHPFISVINTLPDETVRGVASIHYRARMSKAELSAFAKDVQKTVPALKLDDQKVLSIQKANIPSQPFDVWIAKDSGYMSQLKVADAQNKTSVQINLYDYNKPVNVTKPQGAKPLFEALGGVIVGR